MLKRKSRLCVSIFPECVVEKAGRWTLYLVDNVVRVFAIACKDSKLSGINIFRFSRCCHGRLSLAIPLTPKTRAVEWILKSHQEERKDTMNKRREMTEKAKTWRKTTTKILKYHDFRGISFRYSNLSWIYLEHKNQRFRLNPHLKCSLESLAAPYDQPLTFLLIMLCRRHELSLWRVSAAAVCIVIRQIWHELCHFSLVLFFAQGEAFAIIAHLHSQFFLCAVFSISLFSLLPRAHPTLLDLR